MIENKISIEGDETAKVLRGAMGHRATWMGLIYKKACEAGKGAEAEKIIQAAIAATGQFQGAAIKKACNPDDLREYEAAFLNKHLETAFEMKLTATKDRLDMEFHYCPLLKAWQDLGFDDATCAKLCELAMEGDRNVAATMGYGFHLGDTIAKGCKTCEISFFKK